MAKTVKRSGVIEGIGLHSGQNVRLELIPEKPGKGVYYILEDHPALPVQVCPANIDSVYLGTNITYKDVSIRTVEHLAAVLNYLGITDLRIQLSSNEIPVLDGSALQYLDFLEDLGLLENGQDDPLVITDTLSVHKDDSFLIALPYEGFKITYTVDYRPAVYGVQTFIYEEGKTDFRKEVAPARTFGQLKDLEDMHKQGLALGASLDNALGVDENGYLNEPRFPDEAVRHKTLDLIGDLFNLGKKVKTNIVAYKSSHKINAMLVKELAKLI